MDGGSRETAALLGGALLFAGMLAARVFHSREGVYGFLVWNLFLAVVPWLAAVGLERWVARRSAGLSCLVAALLGGVWLLFLPNAPYLITDLVHLRARPPVPLWYDVLMLGSAALTGLLAGAFSLRRVQRAVAASLGSIAGYATVLVALPAAGFGIYLGRFARLNSWDLVLHPGTVLAEIAAAGSPRAAVSTLATAALFAVAYLAVAEPPLPLPVGGWGEGRSPSATGRPRPR